MRRAAVPIAFLGTFTLITPSIGVVITPPPSLVGSPAPAAARPLLRMAAVTPAPEATLEDVATARPGARAARVLMDAAKPASPPRTHAVASGDSLWSIARQYGVDVESLAEVNRLGPTSILRLKKAIVIPPRGSAPVAVKPAARPAKAAVQSAKSQASTVAHVVRPGETLWRIATGYGMRVEDVMAANGLREGDVIRPGQRILVSGRPWPRARQSASSASPRGRPGTSPSEPVMADAAVLQSAAAFLWPTRGVITSRFGVRRYRQHHGGIDLAAPHGTPIYATRDGLVTFSGWKNGYGQVVQIDHGDGVTSIYGHASALHVAVGQRAKRGQMIARVGCTGVCTGSHVHFEVRVNGVAVNPLQHLR